MNIKEIHANTLANVADTYINSLNALVAEARDSKISFKHPIHVGKGYVKSLTKTESGIVVGFKEHYASDEVEDKTLSILSLNDLIKVYRRTARAMLKDLEENEVDVIDNDNNDEETQEE